MKNKLINTNSKENKLKIGELKNKLIYYLLATILLFLVSSCTTDQYVPEKKQVRTTIESCSLENELKCLGANVTKRTITVYIENTADFDMEINEIKIYSAGACGSERLNDENFPGILKKGAKGEILVVCNTIPNIGDYLDSPLIIRYKNVEDSVLHTQKGTLNYMVK